MQRCGLASAGALMLFSGAPGLAQERSLSPGINRAYERADYSSWQGIFEQEGREDRTHPSIVSAYIGEDNYTILTTDGTQTSDPENFEILASLGWKLAGFRVPRSSQRFCTSFVNSTTLFIGGGSDADSLIPTNKTYFFDFESRTWSIGAEFNKPRIDHTCVKVRMDEISDE